MKITINSKELKTAALFASTDESRYILNGVLIETRPGKINGPLVIATDGRRLCCIESEAEQEEDSEAASFVLSTAVVKALCHLVTKTFPLVTIEHKPGSERVLFHMPGVQTVLDVEKGALIVGEYPKWRQVVPSAKDPREPVSKLGLNATFVADFVKAAKLLEAEPMMEMNFVGEDRAIEIKLSRAPRFYGVIMPAKMTEAFQQPGFLGLTDNKKAA